MFKKINGYELEHAQLGAGGGAVTIFRTPESESPPDIWQKTSKGAILIVGGPATIREMKRLWTERSRPRIQQLFPIASSTHQKVKTWLGQN